MIARDAMFVVGLALIGCGLWMLSPAAALIAVGVMLSGPPVWRHINGRA